MSSIKSIAVENLSDVAVRETARGASLRCETRQRAGRCVAEGIKPLDAALAPLKPARQPTNGNRYGRPK
jgi:hypothetical protein